MRPQVRAAILLLMIVVVAVVVTFYALAPRAPSPPAVTVARYSIDGSPSALCPYFATSTPAAPLSLAESASFQISWEIRCNANSTPAHSDLESVYSQTHGFVVTSSNLPVTIVQGTLTEVSVTLRAPSSTFDGDLSLWVNATTGG
jgi:hypothetical protein